MGISILEWRSGCEDMGMGVLGWGWQSYACCVYLHHHTVKSSRSTRHSTTSHSGCLTTCQRPMPSWETSWRLARESRWEQIHLLFSNYIPNSPQNQGNENTTQLLVPNTAQLLLFHVVPYPHYSSCIFSSAEGSPSFKWEVGHNCLHRDGGEGKIKAGVVHLHCE